MQADEVGGGPKFSGYFQALDEKSKEFKELDGILDELKEDFKGRQNSEKTLARVLRQSL